MFELVFSSGCVWCWFCASAATPGLLPGLSPAGCVVDSGLSDHAGRRGSRDGIRAPRKSTTSPKQHQNRSSLNWENLKKIAEI
nr:MAG TPA: hypothetical protein [Caudoviricetes sp.]